MSKQTNRRGFTITELVIVIVVIAILAAVLIPTFASLINKANQSADIQAARQMNVALAAGSAVEEPATFEEVIDILAEAGYDAENSLKPITANHQFYWYSTYNTIILANEEDEANPVVVYPTDNDELVANFATDLPKTDAQQVLFDLEAGFRQFVTVEVESAEDVVAALGKGQSVALKEDVTVTQPIAIPAGANTTIDLNGKTLTTAVQEEQSSGTRHFYATENRGTVTIEDGTFNSRGLGNYGTMIIKEDAVVNAIDRNGGAAVWNYAGGEIVIEGGTFTATGGDYATNGEIELEPGVVNNAGKMVINGGTFTAAQSGCYAIISSGELVINNADVTALRGAVCINAGTAVINGGTFKVTAAKTAGGYHALYVEEGASVEIKGGVFTADNYDICSMSGLSAIKYDSSKFTAAEDKYLESK